MDPNATLKQLRQAMSDEDTAEMSPEVYDLFAALDQWLCRGGFLPDAWKRMGDRG